MDHFVFPVSNGGEKNGPKPIKYIYKAWLKYYGNFQDLKNLRYYFI